jgi:outer membrane protein assembly factor BamA
MANRTPIALVLLCVLAMATGWSQDQIQPQRAPFFLGPVDSIVVSGNKHTRPYVILNEMSIVAHEQFTPEMIEFDRNRIYSLGLFTSVDLYLDTLDARSILRVLVSERWYIFPVPLFGFRDGDVKRAYYGAGLYHHNFSGRNQKLFGSVVFGADPSAQLSFFDPLIDHEHHLSLGAQLSFSRTRNRSEREQALSGTFDELHYDANISTGKRFDLYQYLGINLGYNMVEVPSYRTGRTVSTTGTDRYIYGSVFYSYDSRDLAEYPMQGNYAYGYVTRYGFGTSEVNFTRMGLDLRKYIALPLSLTLAFRLNGAMMIGGEIPTYAHLYLGYGDRVRGYFTTVFEGENVVCSTVELRYPLLPARVFRVNNGILPDEFSIWRFGISLTLFADAGTTWYRQQRVPIASVASGYGGGIDFLLPYGVVVRTDYAWNNYGRGQFILDFRRAI